MPATNSSDINVDVGVTSLVYNYLKATHGLESLAEVYKQKFKPAAIPHNSPSLQQVFDHFQENAAVKRRLSLTPTPAKKVKKNSNNDANLSPKSEILKIPQKRKMESNDASAHSVQFVEVMNSLVYDYLKTIPATVPLAEQYRMKFNPPTVPQNSPSLQHVFDHFQETAPVKRRLSMNILSSSSSSPAKKVKRNGNDDVNLSKVDKSNIPQIKMKSEEDNLINSLVYNYLKTIPTSESLAEQYKTMFNPPALSKGLSTLEDVFSHFQVNAPINRRLVLDLSPPSSNNTKSNDDSSLTNNKPAAVESINTLIRALIREKTTVKKKREPSSAKTSNIPHSTPNNASLIKIKQEQQATKPNNIQVEVGERKPQMHKPDSYNYNHSTTSSRPLNNSTSISTNVKKIANPTPAYLAWTRWDNSVSYNNPKQCFQCLKIFPLRSSHLKVHFYSHMTRMEKKIVESGWDKICYFCSKRFISFSALVMHFVIHTTERPFKCDVVGCGKTCPFACDMKLHARSHSSKLAERLPFECGVCGQRYTVKYLLRNHVESVHEGIRHKCRWCDADFSRESDKKAHEKKLHPEEFKKESEKDE